MSLPPRRQLLLAVAGAAGLVAAFVLSRHFFWPSGSGAVPRGIDADGHPFLGAARPRVVVHEYVDYACPHCGTAASRMARAVAQHPDELRVVRHDYPRMRCPRIPPFQHCQYARIALCAGDQGKFWEMDSWLFAAVETSLKLDLGQAARETGVDEGKLRECVALPGTFERADREAREAESAGVSATPTYVIDGKTFLGSAVFDALEARL